MGEIFFFIVCSNFEQLTSGLLELPTARCRYEGREHQCLKVMEIEGLSNATSLKEMAIYVLENASSLEKMIIDGDVVSGNCLNLLKANLLRFGGIDY